MSRQTEHHHRRPGRRNVFRYSAILGAFILAAAAAPFARADSIPLRLIAFNDFHGHLEPGSKTLPMPDPSNPAKKTAQIPAGGAAWMAGLIGKLRGEAPNSMVFSSGDMFSAAPLVSTLFRHESTVAVMNAIGLDFAIVGNHEFDGGLDELRRVAGGGCAANNASSPFVSCALGGSYAGARFPFLAANVLGPDGQPIFAPTLVREFGGVKVGFIGVVTRALPSMVSPAGIAGLKVLDEAETLNKYADELNRQGVEAIVAVVHEGGAAELRWDDPCFNRTGEIFAIADKLSPRIDLVFSAHTHQRYNCVVDTPNQKGLRVIQATSYGRALSVIDVTLNTATRRLERDGARSRIEPVINQTVDGYTAAPSDPAVARMVSDYVAQAAATSDRPVGRVAGPIDLTPPAASPTAIDSPAGHMVADAQLAATRSADAGAAQIAFVNAGGVRAPLPCQATPPCTATYGQAFTMQPFGNTLVSMTLTGEQLKALLEEQLPADGKEPHFMAPSSGFTYTWKGSAPFGQRAADLTLDGAPVRPEARYRITVNSFLAEGGDKHKLLTEGAERVGGPLDVDALVDFLKTHDGNGGRELYSADTAPRIRLAE